MTKITQSKELTSFYKAYNDWLEAGAPKNNWFLFSRSVGLCSAIRKYSAVLKYATPRHLEKIYSALKCDSNTFLEMESQFKNANLDTKYPFGEMNFCRGIRYESNHIDPNRIRWVRAHLTEEVEKEFILQ